MKKLFIFGAFALATLATQNSYAGVVYGHSFFESIVKYDTQINYEARAIIWYPEVSEEGQKIIADEELEFERRQINSSFYVSNLEEISPKDAIFQYINSNTLRSEEVSTNDFEEKGLEAYSTAYNGNPQSTRSKIGAEGKVYHVFYQWRWEAVSAEDKHDVSWSKNELNLLNSGVSVEDQTKYYECRDKVHAVYKALPGRYKKIIKDKIGHGRGSKKPVISANILLNEQEIIEIENPLQNLVTNPFVITKDSVIRGREYNRYIPGKLQIKGVFQNEECHTFTTEDLKEFINNSLDD